MPYQTVAKQRITKGAIQRRLMGQRDARGPVGELSRGKTTYFGGSSAAHRGGGPQFGRPKGSRDKVPTRSAIRRRIAARRK